MFLDQNDPDFELTMKKKIEFETRLKTFSF